jgi:hypothetical protein
MPKWKKLHGRPTHRLIGDIKMDFIEIDFKVARWTGSGYGLVSNTSSDEGVGIFGDVLSAK